MALSPERLRAWQLSCRGSRDSRGRSPTKRSAIPFASAFVHDRPAIARSPKPTFPRQCPPAAPTVGRLLRWIDIQSRKRERTVRCPLSSYFRANQRVQEVAELGLEEQTDAPAIIMTTNQFAPKRTVLEERPRAFGLVQKAATASFERLESSRTFASVQPFQVWFGADCRQFVYVESAVARCECWPKRSTDPAHGEECFGRGIGGHEDTTCARLR